MFRNNPTKLGFYHGPSVGVGSPKAIQKEWKFNESQTKAPKLNQSRVKGKVDNRALCQGAICGIILGQKSGCVCIIQCWLDITFYHQTGYSSNSLKNMGKVTITCIQQMKQLIEQFLERANNLARMNQHPPMHQCGWMVHSWVHIFHPSLSLG